MKHAKKPTLAQKITITKFGLKWINWLVLEETEDKLVVQNKISKKIRELKKR